MAFSRSSGSIRPVLCAGRNSTSSGMCGASAARSRRAASRSRCRRSWRMGRTRWAASRRGAVRPCAATRSTEVTARPSPTLLSASRTARTRSSSGWPNSRQAFMFIYVYSRLFSSQLPCSHRAPYRMKMDCIRVASNSRGGYSGMCRHEGRRLTGAASLNVSWTWTSGSTLYCCPQRRGARTLDFTQAEGLPTQPRRQGPMQVLFERCAALDVHKAFVVACRILTLANGKTELQTRTFETTTAALLALRDWLAAFGCTHVAMESTGEYWKPVYNILEGAFELWVV